MKNNCLAYINDIEDMDEVLSRKGNAQSALEIFLHNIDKFKDNTNGSILIRSTASLEKHDKIDLLKLKTYVLVEKYHNSNENALEEIAVPSKRDLKHDSGKCMQFDKSKFDEDLQKASTSIEQLYSTNGLKRMAYSFLGFLGYDPYGHLAKTAKKSITQVIDGYDLRIQELSIVEEELLERINEYKNECKSLADAIANDKEDLNENKMALGRDLVNCDRIVNIAEKKLYDRREMIQKLKVAKERFEKFDRSLVYEPSQKRLSLPAASYTCNVVHLTTT